MAAAIQSIGTHSGSFHCDEALACYMLRLTKAFKDWPVVRTRDAAVLATLPIVVDVGGEYDSARHRYDHHQRGFDQTFDEKHQTKLSSAGLVYKHFGREVIAAVTNKAQDDAVVELLYQKIYDDFVEALDGIDNGISQYPKDVEPRYRSNTHLSARVGRLNPAWNQAQDDATMDAAFQKAMALAGGEFSQTVLSALQIWLPARAIVEKALASRLEVDKSGEIIVLEQYTVWPSHLHDLEQEQKIDPLVSYCLFQDTAGAWRIQAVAVRPGSFENRKPLPEAWRGIRDAELDKVCGVEGCIFVHAGGFIGGHKTKEGVLAMAREALAIHNTKKRKADAQP